MDWIWSSSIRYLGLWKRTSYYLWWKTTVLTILCQYCFRSENIVKSYMPAHNVLDDGYGANTGTKIQYLFTVWIVSSLSYCYSSVNSVWSRPLNQTSKAYWSIECLSEMSRTSERDNISNPRYLEPLKDRIPINQSAVNPRETSYMWNSLIFGSSDVGPSCSEPDGRFYKVWANLK